MKEHGDREVHQRAVEILGLVEAIRPLLAGRKPEVQAAVIGHMTAIYLSGWRGAGRHEARKAVLKVMNELALEMVKIEERGRG
jgi:hypothetical protein